MNEDDTHAKGEQPSASNSTPPTSLSDTTVKFIVTGFGPFQNSKDNPTTCIANRLIEYLKNREFTNDASLRLAALTTTLVIETSANAAREEMDQLYDKHVDDMSDQTTVFIHLGVNVRGTYFQLEQCAYNDATFRIPDERGYQPTNKKIVDNLDYQKSLSTCLDISDLKCQLNTQCAESPVQLSTNPGRFVCNYTYFYSLLKSQKYEGCIQSIFLHVPPFTVIREEEQMRVVVALMDSIYIQVTSRIQSMFDNMPICCKEESHVTM